MSTKKIWGQPPLQSPSQPIGSPIANFDDGSSGSRDTDISVKNTNISRVAENLLFYFLAAHAAIFVKNKR